MPFNILLNSLSIQNNVENNTINIHVSSTQICQILVFFLNMFQIFFFFNKKSLTKTLLIL